jgi:DNA-binding transcriptional regulator YiaG
VLTPEQYEQLYREKIKLARMQLNLTQPEFADKLGVSLQAVSGWESGRRFPRARMRRRIDRFLEDAGVLV